MNRPNWFIFIFTLFFLFDLSASVIGADFSDWEGAGKVVKRFGEESSLKNAREWLQWAEGRLLLERFQEKGVQSEENLHKEILADWEKAEKEETKTYTFAKFLLNDHWHGYEYLSLSYTNLDFMEQAFGIHFELMPRTLMVDQVLNRYGKKEMEIRDQDGKKTLRYAIPSGDSLKKTPWESLQSQVEENDEFWVEFELRNDTEIRSVEVLAVKAKPYKTPFTKNWRWDE